MYGELLTDHRKREDHLPMPFMINFKKQLETIFLKRNFFINNTNNLTNWFIRWFRQAEKGVKGMKIPEIPKHHSITREQALVELLDSIAYGEDVISQLIKVEAIKTSKFTGKSHDHPKRPNNEEIIQYCQSLNQIVGSIHMEERMLLEKLEMILHTTVDSEPDHPKKHHRNKLL